MKKILLCLALLLLLTAPCAAATEPVATAYHNADYGFTMQLPAGFVPVEGASASSLLALRRNGLTLQLLHFTPAKPFPSKDFASWPPEVRQKFIKQQSFATSVKTPKFKLYNYDTHATASQYPYLWTMYMAVTQFEQELITTTLLKNFFVVKGELLELDFILTDAEKADIALVTSILDSIEIK